MDPGRWESSGLVKVLTCLSNERSASERLIACTRSCCHIYVRVFAVSSIVYGVANTGRFYKAKVRSKRFEFGQVRMLNIDMANPGELDFVARVRSGRDSR